MSSGVEKVVEDDERESRHEEKSKSSKNDKIHRPDKKRKVEWITPATLYSPSELPDLPELP